MTTEDLDPMEFSAEAEVVCTLEDPRVQMKDEALDLYLCERLKHHTYPISRRLVDPHNPAGGEVVSFGACIRCGKASSVIEAGIKMDIKSAAAGPGWSSMLVCDVQPIR